MTNVGSLKDKKRWKESENMYLRRYDSSDCAEMARLFYETVHTINAKDYSEEQLNAWASGSLDEEAWDRSFREHYTIVAVTDGEIIGFGDMDQWGYLDRLYVHKNHQREGIATAICDILEKNTNSNRIITYASITAKSFFLKRGYQVIKKQQVIRKNVILTNYRMEKEQ